MFDRERVGERRREWEREGESGLARSCVGDREGARAREGGRERGVLEVV